MTDIVKRLREDEAQLQQMVSQASFSGSTTGVRVKNPSFLLDDLSQAAAEIERLRANIDRLTGNPVDHRYWEGRYRDEKAENERLRKSLEFYANPKIYKPHPHGIGFDRRDLSFHAKAALNASSNGGAE